MNGKENRKVLEQMDEQEMKRVAIEKYVNIQRINLQPLFSFRKSKNLDLNKDREAR